MSERCRVCADASGFDRYDVPRYRYGVEGVEGTEAVPYLHCRSCGSLLIERIPTDPGREYGPGYHSPVGRRLSPLRLLRRVRGKHAAGGRTMIGAALHRLFPDGLEDFGRLLRLAGAAPSSAVLDVGCGNGEILARMRSAGYRNLVGVDPFLPDDATGANGVRLIRSELSTLARSEPGTRDLVMFNHSLEHVQDPQAMLETGRRMLRPGGRILVRIPVADCEAWERYGTEWIQIDAPRHLFIPSRRGMRTLSERAGLRLEATLDDSTEIQFLGSELYRDGRRYDELQSRYGWDVRRRMRREARLLNARSRGDQAGFVLAAREEGPAS